MLIKILFAIPLIAAIALAGVFYNDYQNKSSEADTLAQKVQAERALEQSLTQQTRTLTSQLDELNLTVQRLQADVDNVAVNVPERMNSNDILEKVLDLGETHQVTVIPLNSRDWSSTKLGQNEYQIFHMSLSLKGEQEAIVNFLAEMQSELYPTLVLEDVSLTRQIAPVVVTPTPITTPTELEVETLEAEDVRDVSAILCGDLVGLDTRGVFYVSFEWGETTNYTESTTPDVVYHTGKFSYLLTGLSPETHYHYRAVVKGLETKYGVDKTFKTLAGYVPPVPIINAEVNLAIYAR